MRKKYRHDKWYNEIQKHKSINDIFVITNTEISLFRIKYVLFSVVLSYIKMLSMIHNLCDNI